MSIDLQTLVLFSSITNFLQVIILFVQYWANKTYKGLGWWALGGASGALGFAVTFLRTSPVFGSFAIVANNILYVSGLALPYVGVLRFFGQAERRKWLGAFLILHSLLTIYFVYIDNNQDARRLLTSGAIATFSFLISKHFLSHQIRSLRVISYFLAIVFLFYGIFFGLRVLSPLWATSEAVYLVTLIGSMLWTFGFIMLVNQRLNMEIRDAQEKTEESERKYHLLATTDEVTGVWNRRHFLDVAHAEIARAVRLGYPLSLALLDLDRFKHINDAYGHMTGDQALTILAGVCREYVRETDLFARFGGDEFILLLPNTNVHQAYEVVQRICTIMASEPIILDGKPVAITISAGIASLLDRQEDFGTLLSRADQALYRSKGAGRNCVSVGDGSIQP